MYAVKGGHVEIVKHLMECDYLDCNVKTRVSLFITLDKALSSCSKH